MIVETTQSDGVNDKVKGMFSALMLSRLYEIALLVVVVLNSVI
jgi:hypothetical protein